MIDYRHSKSLWTGSFVEMIDRNPLMVSPERWCNRLGPFSLENCTFLKSFLWVPMLEHWGQRCRMTSHGQLFSESSIFEDFHLELLWQDCKCASSDGMYFWVGKYFVLPSLGNMKYSGNFQVEVSFGSVSQALCDIYHGLLRKKREEG